MTKRILTILLLTLGVGFILIQLYRPERNQSDSPTTQYDISRLYPMSDEVQTILKTSCYDCHSNNTNYPWYAEIQPVASWLADHIEEGKHELNFNEFGKRRIAIQLHKFEEITEQLEEDEMPLPSYTLIHRNAVLNPTQKESLVSWVKSSMSSIKSSYPADSLILRRK